VKKGALFLLDKSDGSYVSWAQSGYDSITVSKLKIPESFEFLNEESDERSMIKKDNFGFFENFFSTSEFPLLENILFLPASFGNTICAVLMITETPFFVDRSEEMVKTCKKVFRDISPILNKLVNLFNHRETERRVGREDGGIGELKKYFKGMKKEYQKILILEIDIRIVIEQISESVQSADTENLHKKLLLLLESMLSENGRILILNNNKILLILSGRSIDDEQLVAHQILQIVRIFFHTGNFSNLIRSVTPAPETEDEMESFFKNHGIT